MREQLDNRTQAGRELATRLRHLSPDSIVLGLPRGGVPVAAEVARERGWRLDVAVVRKLGVPWQPELAMGAVCEGGVTVMNDDVVAQTGVTKAQVSTAAERERVVVEERVRMLRGGAPPPDLDGRSVVIVDDGIATGATMKAACKWARMNGAVSVVVAVPVAPHGWERDFEQIADECIAVMTPDGFGAVGQWYRDFSEVTDGDVVRLLAAFREQPFRSSFIVRVDDHTPLSADVTVPEGPRGCVVFVHGSGSSRLSPRNRHVARILNESGFATVLFDLLTEGEAADRGNVFDIGLLTARLEKVVEWVRTQRWAEHLGIGLFGASTGAAAALGLAAHRPGLITSVVSRGGRPDLAGDDLPAVRCPVLLVVGSLDRAVLELNRTAARRMGGHVTVTEVKGATHLFEEPGTLDSAAHLARDFFLGHLQWPAIAAAG